MKYFVVNIYEICVGRYSSRANVYTVSKFDDDDWYQYVEIKDDEETLI